MKYKFLIVDDDINLVINLKQTIEKNMSSFIEKISICKDGEEAIKEIYKLKPDILLLDLKIPKMDGLAILKKVKDIIVFIISGETSLINNLEILNSRYVKKIYIKPFPLNHLIKELKYICCQQSDDNVRESIKIKLNNFKFNKNSVGYQYLIECLLKIFRNPILMDNIEKELFPIVAKEFGIDNIKNVKWCMQKSMKSMLRYTKREIIFKYFPNNATPTLKFFIITMSESIINQLNT